MFLAANQDYPEQLFDEQYAAATDGIDHTPFTYTQGQLSFYSATKDVAGMDAAGLKALLSSGDSASKIAIANPKLAPYGASAQAYLQNNNLYKSLQNESRMIQAENIGQTFQYAHTGNVDYGFVAQSQVTAVNAPDSQYFILPKTSYPAIRQDGMQLTDHAHAADFIRYLRDENGQRFFADAGYLSVN